MRILFIGGFYRGYLLAKRLLERGENLVGAFVYEEDAHESPKYCELIASQFIEANVWTETTRKITTAHLPTICGELSPDIVFCLGWRTLIPTDVLQSAPHGGVAVHDSLLPRLRGFAPTNWGLILGHDLVGATLFQLTDSVDAGDIYFQQSIAVRPDENYESIQERIAEASVRLFDNYLDAARMGTLAGRAQDHSLATYTCARTPADGEIDWRSTSQQIARLIRALQSPAPGAYTYHAGEPLVIDEAYHVAEPHNYEGRIPGRVIDRDSSAGSIDVLCGDGVLRVLRVRTPDGASHSAAAVVKSVRGSLGLQTNQEIVQLRARLNELENRVRQLDSQLPLAAPGSAGALSTNKLLHRC
jgi:methionyl-tRNA formyltransferase